VPYVIVALVACAPILVVKYPPVQDLPMHLATMRVIHSFGDPSYGFRGDFVLRLGSTQYVLYYLLGSALAYALGVVKANLVLVCAYFAGSVLAMRALLGALEQDRRMALAVVPLLYNVILLTGLLPFLLGVPVMLWAMAVSVRYLERPTPWRGVLLGVLAASLFFLHVFPFAIFGIAFAALFPWQRPAAWVRAAAPTVPALALVAWWTLLTPAGHLVRGGLLHPDVPSPLTPLGKIADAYNWLGDVYRDLSDETLMGTLLGIVVVSAALARGQRAPRASSLWRLALVPLACFAMMMVTGDEHGHIWLIWQRFPILLAITLIPLARMPAGRRGQLVTSGLAAVALASTLNACVHWVRFQRDDVGDFDEALRVMEPRKHVAGLIFDKVSSVVFRHPLVHFVSYYLVAKGGVVEFTCAGHPHWPYTFRPDRMPPEGAPTRINWEWTPELVTSGELYPYFDYVLTRGEGWAPAPGTFHLAWSGQRWKVWQRD
jgi:hypothetical protein